MKEVTMYKKADDRCYFFIENPHNLEAELHFTSKPAEMLDERYPDYSDNMIDWSLDGEELDTAAIDALASDWYGCYVLESVEDFYYYMVQYKGHNDFSVALSALEAFQFVIAGYVNTVNDAILLMKKASVDLNKEISCMTTEELFDYAKKLDEKEFYDYVKQLNED